MAKLKILEELEKLWEKVTNNKKDIQTINNKHRITSYTLITELGLTDAQFEGLTQVQAFDLLIETMPYNSYLQCRLTEAEHTFRMAIAGSIWGQVGTGWLRVDVTSFKRYRAEITDETDASLMFSSVGYPTYSSVWNKEVNENILNTRGYLTTKRIFPCDTATLNGLINNGKYSVSTSEIIDGIPAGWYNVDVTHHGVIGHCTQVLKHMGSSDAQVNGDVYTRTLVTGSSVGGERWDTKKIATTDKTVRTYKTLTEINSTFTESTPVKDVILAMEDNSMAVYKLNTKVPNYYNEYGIVTINKVNDASNKVSLQLVNNRNFTTNHHPVGNPDCEWKELLITEDLQSRGVVEAKPNLPQNADANTVVVNGIYQIWDDGTHEAINFPIINPIGTLVVTNSDNFPVQTFTHYTGIMWFRSRGAGADEWSTWHQVTTQTKVEITSSMLKNGWTLWDGFKNSIIKDGDSIKINLMVSGGDGSRYNSIVEGLPTISAHVMLSGASNSGQIVLVCYKTDGSITFQATMGVCNWIHINGVINL